MDVYSTFPSYMTEAMFEYGFATDYATISGTSMAAPHVAGVAALIRDLHPDWSAQQVKQQLLGTVDPIAGLRRHHSHGRPAQRGHCYLRRCAATDPRRDRHRGEHGHRRGRLYRDAFRRQHRDDHRRFRYQQRHRHRRQRLPGRERYSDLRPRRNEQVHYRPSER